MINTSDFNLGLDLIHNKDSGSNSELSESTYFSTYRVINFFGNQEIRKNILFLVHLALHYYNWGSGKPNQFDGTFI